jgi:ABC-type branched-subunit amino acid transport system substrate-binding protein
MIRALALVALLVACIHSRRTLMPEPAAPHNGDATARARFLDARSKFLRDGSEAGEFAQIVEQYPSDPIVPLAELYSGIAAIKQRDFAGADAHLAKVVSANADAALQQRARLFLGIAKNYEGDSAGAGLLLAGADCDALDSDDERVECAAAVAYTTAAGNHPLAALPLFDKLYRNPQLTPTERAALVGRVEDVVASAEPNELARAYDGLSPRDGVAGAVAGSRLALIAEASGDVGRAQKLRAAVAQPRTAIGLPRTIGSEVGGATATSSGGTQGLVGAALPLAGKNQKVGADAARGLALAAGAADGSGIAAVETRVADDEGTATAAFDDLARVGVIAIIGPYEKKAVDAAAGRANALGVPMLSLSTVPEQRPAGRFVFHMWHSPEARARALAKRALAEHLTTFLVLRPDNLYGKSVGDAFMEEIARGGGTLVGSAVDYPQDASATTLVKLVNAGKLGSGWQAVFVPDTAAELELVASAINGDKSRIIKPIRTKKTKALKGAQPVVLLATAEGLEGKFLANTGNSADGALLAPGFYADDTDPAAKDFLDRFKGAYGGDPKANEAYAYDAAQLAAAGGARSRGALADTIAHGAIPGVTGTIQFDAAHRRADPPHIYSVVQEDNGYAIRLLPPPQQPPPPAQAAAK